MSRVPLQNRRPLRSSSNHPSLSQFITEKTIIFTCSDRDVPAALVILPPPWHPGVSAQPATPGRPNRPPNLAADKATAATSRRPSNMAALAPRRPSSKAPVVACWPSNMAAVVFWPRQPIGQIFARRQQRCADPESRETWSAQLVHYRPATGKRTDR